jgi:catechol-2,3-dioxygenase
MSTPAVDAIALHVSIPVLDAVEAEEFYAKAFGARTVSRTNSLVTMNLAKQRLALRQVSTDSVSLQQDASKGLRARHFGFAVSTPSEVDAAVESLNTLGAQLVVKPTDRPDGRSAVFCDHSGNQVEIYYEKEVHDG